MNYFLVTCISNFKCSSSVIKLGYFINSIYIFLIFTQFFSCQMALVELIITKDNACQPYKYEVNIIISLTFPFYTFKLSRLKEISELPLVRRVFFFIGCTTDFQGFSCYTGHHKKAVSIEIL